MPVLGAGGDDEKQH